MTTLTEQEILAKGLTAPRITPADVEAAISSTFYFTVRDGVLGESEMGTTPAKWTGLDLVTICATVLKNGHRIIGVNTGPVSADNFDKDLGRRLAREDAVRQIWPLMGYQLRATLFEEAKNAG